MINNLILVGRLTKDPELRKAKETFDVCTLSLAVDRPFRDMTTGEKGVDFINVSLWNGISKYAYQFASKGDIVGIKGRVADRVRVEDGINKHVLEVIGEKICFIHSTKQKEAPKFTEETDFNDNLDDDIPDEELNGSI